MFTVKFCIFSTQIRKRKLEKADILELTVKHLRNLQNIHSCEFEPLFEDSGTYRCLMFIFTHNIRCVYAQCFSP